jgi:hypothetical protein
MDGGCTTSPSTLFEIEYIILGSSTYTALPTIYTMNKPDGATTTLSYTFPNLTMTMFTPGEEVDVVRVLHFEFNNQSWTYPSVNPRTRANGNA